MCDSVRLESVPFLPSLLTYSNGTSRAKERDMEAKASKHASKCEHACARAQKKKKKKKEEEECACASACACARAQPMASARVHGKMSRQQRA